jgi:hypothetical protein
MEGYRDYWVKNAVSGAKNSAGLVQSRAKPPPPRQEIATNLDGDQVKRCGEEFDSTPTTKMDMGGCLYHAGAHSPITEQTHFTSETKA